ncbi:hybrid sensor histidine kinase/response regulator [Natronorarus salvus]|uniref:hybrid sensor histidine kinase/response regulator n=1 Tax=Natronorarus salvus TaxID=3117733 RepID=UPI002F25F233
MSDTQSDAKTLSILLVEDNPGDARLIEEMLAEATDRADGTGYPVTEGPTTVDLVHETTLADARGRLEVFDADVVLLDLRLPDSTDMETIESILADVAETPVIVLTGMPESSLGVDAIARGAQDYLVKDDLIGGGTSAEMLLRSIWYAIERKRTEQELRQRTRELAILNQLTRHDIRNDITLVVGRARELGEHVEPRGEALLEEIVQSSNHILQLTRTVGDVVESVVGEERELSTVDLGTIVETEVKKAEQLYDGVEISVTTDLPESEVRANELLSSVFGNLLSNAVFYNDKETPVIEIGVEEDEEQVTVRVADNGPGIPAHRRDRIFEEGEQGAESTGMGIGLSLVDRLVTRYGGEIWIEANEPEGSVFCVSLRRASPRADRPSR